jgi:hypothetical protein
MNRDPKLRYTRVVTAVHDLRHIRDYLSALGAKQPTKLLAKIRSAIKSAEGATRNAWRFQQREEQAQARFQQRNIERKRNATTLND